MLLEEKSQNWTWSGLNPALKVWWVCKRYSKPKEEQKPDRNEQELMKAFKAWNRKNYVNEGDWTKYDSAQGAVVYKDKTH